MSDVRIAANGAPDAIMSTQVLRATYGFSVLVERADGMRLALQK